MDTNDATLDIIPREEDWRFKEASADDPHRYHEANFYAFNTIVTFKASGDRNAVEAAFLAGRDACRTYERLFSRFLPHSDIARINESRGASVVIARDTYDVLAHSLRYCELSEGMLDITMGSVTRLWDFHRGIIPDQESLDEAVAHVGWQKLKLLDGDDVCIATLSDPEASIDVGGTAKGWIADRLIDLMTSQGLEHLFVNLGGNVAVHGGRPDGTPFRIGVKDPRDASQILGAVSIANGSVVTSGLYERMFEKDGRRFAHILNPQTGMPVETDVEGVTVVGPRSVDCEGFSTTLCALGIEYGMDYARSRPEITTAVFIDRDNVAHVVDKTVPSASK
ncbi:FAD:protein FMN transferase [Slackia exigua]|uniref:FAD:protein FMN transferase n=1 Tax=Slackia exigua TaxID=84109 RepID=UPI003AB99D7B